MSHGLENVVVIRREESAIELEHRICAPPHGTDVMFAVLRAAVCGTDRQIARGLRGDRAAILGHEGVAEVRQVGEEVRSHVVGERFVFNPVNPKDQDEILGHSTEGIFQRYFTVSEEELERRSLLVPVPDGTDIDACVLAEPLGTVVYTHELLDTVRTPESVLILGAGAIGILHALYAHEVRRIPKVGVVCNRASRAEWLRRRSILPDAVRIFDRAADEIEESMPAIDAVLFCLPARATTEALRLASRVVSTDGCIGLIGGVDRARIEELPGLDLVEVRRMNACGECEGPAAMTETATDTGKLVRVFGHRGSAERHLETALDSIARHSALRRVLTHRLTLGALPAVLTTLCERSSLVGSEYLKGLVDCTADGEAVTLLEEV